MINPMKNQTSMAGFTLIEVLIALVIVSVAILSIGNFTMSMVGSGQVSRERITAVHLAEQVLEFWQHDADDYAPAIAADCALSTAAGAPSYPVNVNCTPTSGIGIAYTIQADELQVTGPLPGNLSSFQNFSKQGYDNTPQTKLVTVFWSNKGKSHNIYLTHLSMVK